MSDSQETERHRSTRKTGLKNQVTLEFLKTKVEEIVSSFASNKRNFPKELVDDGHKQ